MNIIGCDLHTRYQVIANLDTETGEMVSRRFGTREWRSKDVLQEPGAWRAGGD
jgi:hypothetical protein